MVASRSLRQDVLVGIIFFNVIFFATEFTEISENILGKLERVSKDMRIPGVVYVLSRKEESYKTRRPLGSGVDLHVGRGYCSRGNGLICIARDKTFLMP